MSWADVAAVVTKIKTVPVLASATYITLAPKPAAPATVLPLPYVIVHPSDGTDEATRLTGPPVTTNPMFTLHIVGGSAEQVLVVQDLVKPLFQVGGFIVPPVVAGRSNRDGYWRSPIPLQIDRDLTPALVYQVIELGWTSDPS
jgi:hypothetical protein